jgi:hypothetical protein
LQETDLAKTAKMASQIPNLATGTRPIGNVEDCRPIGNVEDFTGTAQRLEDTDLYSRAIAVSSARVSTDECDAPPQLPTFRQKMKRRVEVPYTRQVRVPTTTTKIVPTMVDQTIPVKRLIQVPSFEMVDEEYTEFEEREAEREKEVWVKQIVMEKYIEKVPITKVRQVKRPTTVIQEIEEMQTVQVPGSKTIQVDGFRIDEVEDRKMVEVEEFEEFEYRPVATGRKQLHRTRELGRVPGNHISRRVGNQVIDNDFCAPNGELDQVDIDSNPGISINPAIQYQAQQAPQQQMRASNSFYRSSNSGLPIVGQGPQPGDAQASYANDSFTDTAFVRAAGDYQKKAAEEPTSASDSRGIGMTVKNTHTRHTDGTGVLVTKVERSSPAARSGLCEGDLITSVANRPTSTVEQFREALTQIPGPVTLTVNRDGRRNVALTMYR